MHGIYAIRHKESGKQYIGSSVNIAGRWRRHLRRLLKGTHVNPHLQSAFALYGEEAFEFVVLEEVRDRKMLIQKEQHYFDTLHPEYNCNLVADKPPSRLGQILSAKTRKRMGLKGEKHPLFGKHHSAEARKKISDALKGEKHHMFGKHHSEETRQKMSKPRSEQARKNISKGVREANRNRVVSVETREKMSEAHKKRLSSVEARKKQSEAAKQGWANRDRTVSIETRRKISEAAKERFSDPQTRKKRSESAKRAWARKRAREAATQ